MKNVTKAFLSKLRKNGSILLLLIIILTKNIIKKCYKIIKKLTAKIHVFFAPSACNGLMAHEGIGRALREDKILALRKFK